MTRFQQRRPYAFLGLVLACCVYAWLHLSLDTRFWPVSIWSGIFLFALIAALASFNGRKKLPFIPLMKAATWMQIHVYVGLFSMVIYLFHTNFRWPDGGLEILVAALFVSVSLSGVFGLLITRLIPSQITAHGESVIFEQIPGLRAELRKEVEQLVIESETTTQSSTIADFYGTQLADYFMRPRHVWGHMLGSPRPLNTLLERITALGRYLNDEEKQTTVRIAELVRAKNNLDHQWYLQGALKLWLFAHIPLTFALILFAGTHGWIAWRFTG